MTKDGDMISWRGIGTGKPSPDGGIVWRAALTYQTASTRLAKLNRIVGAVEFETDAEGNTKGSTWEWQ